MLLGLGWAALPACGIGWPGGPALVTFCPARAAVAAPVPIEAELVRESVLRNRLDSLRRRAAAAEAACRQTAAGIEGCWELIGEHRALYEGSGEPSPFRDWRLCLDARGRGDHHATLRDGTSCRGPLQTTRNGAGRARVMLPETSPCTGSAAEMRPGAMDCALLADGTADCVGRTDGVDRTTPVRFRRVRG